MFAMILNRLLKSEFWTALCILRKKSQPIFKHNHVSLPQVIPATQKKCAQKYRIFIPGNLGIICQFVTLAFFNRQFFRGRDARVPSKVLHCSEISQDLYPKASFVCLKLHQKADSSILEFNHTIRLLTRRMPQAQARQRAQRRVVTRLKRAPNIRNRGYHRCPRLACRMPQAQARPMMNAPLSLVQIVL